MVRVGTQNWKIQSRQDRYHLSGYKGRWVYFWYRFDLKSKIVALLEREGDKITTKYNTDFKSQVLKIAELDSDIKLSKIPKLRHL